MTIISDRLDGVQSSVALKAPVRVATTVNITLSGLQTVDGVSLAADDRVLVKDQTDATENGIWNVSSTAWSRAKDFDGARDVVSGTRVFINAGTVGAGKEAQLTTADPVVIGTSDLTFTLILLLDAAGATDLETVADNIADVSTVADDLTGADDIGTVADNIDDISGIVATAGLKYVFDDATGMADPGTGDVRLDNATVASVTNIAVSATFSGGSDVSGFIVTWDDSTHSPRGTIIIRKSGAATTFAVFSVTGSITDNGTWLQIPVTHVASSGSLTVGDALFLAFSRSGDNGILTEVVEDTSPQLGGVLDTNSHQVRWSKGADIASPAGGALTLGTDGNYFDITGTNAITSIVTVGIGTVIKLHFDAALTLTHHATDLVLPGAASITTAAGDEAEFVEYASGDWRCTKYQKADGTAVVAPPASTEGTTFIGRLTPSGATAEFTGFDDTYDAIVFVVSGCVPDTDDVDFQMEFGTGATPTWITSYAGGLRGLPSAGSADDRPFNGSATAPLSFGDVAGDGVGSTSGEAMNATVTLYRPSQVASIARAAFQSHYTDSGGITWSAAGASGAAAAASAAITALRFSWEGGGNFAAGVITAYGVNKA